MPTYLCPRRPCSTTLQFISPLEKAELTPGHPLQALSRETQHLVSPSQVNFCHGQQRMKQSLNQLASPGEWQAEGNPWPEGKGNADF